MGIKIYLFRILLFQMWSFIVRREKAEKLIAARKITRSREEIMTDHSSRRRWRRLRLGTAVIAVLCGTATFAATPARAGTGTQFSDGSFETPVVAPGTFQRLFAGQSIGPWTVTAGNVDLSGKGFWQTADGAQSLDLDGAQNGAVSQTFSTIPLFAYEVSFALAGNPVSGPAIKTGQALINGQVVKDFSFDTTGKSETNMGYVTEELTFLATGKSTTLTFASTTTPSGFGPVIDNVEVQSCLIIVCLN